MTAAGATRWPGTWPPRRGGSRVLSSPADLASHAFDARQAFDLSGRVSVVTGATRGLGLAIAHGFASAGARVAIISRKADACEQVAAALPCHVGHWEELEPLVEAVYSEFGRIDVLVNNAGISPVYDRLTDVSET